jgi:predicted MPP superfamily phosphohydrolase
MVAGHGRRQLDWAARTGDTILGVVWILFAWAILGNVLGLGLAIGGVTDPTRSRIVAAAVAVVSLALAVWGYIEAIRVPRIRRVDVTIPRLGAGLDGVTIVLLTDTHYGPIDRTRWSTRVVDAVNEQVDVAVAHGHTHGGRIWPFHYLVRLDQPVVQGLSQHGERTQLYTSRGTGFWGPPLRIFAPSEITLLTIRVA